MTPTTSGTRASVVFSWSSVASDRTTVPSIAIAAPTIVTELGSPTTLATLDNTSAATAAVPLARIANRNRIRPGSPATITSR